MKIVYYVHDLSFPLREGVRKQAWWLAKAMKQRGHDVEIVSTFGKDGAKKKKRVVRDGIPVHYGNLFQIAAVDADVVHYLSHP
jgi:hypothetical protein